MIWVIALVIVIGLGITAVVFAEKSVFRHVSEADRLAEDIEIIEE